MSPLHLSAVSLLCFSLSWASSGTQLTSPDAHVRLKFHLQTDGSPSYRISFFGKPIILESRLGFDPALTNHFQVLRQSWAQHEGQWTNILGERSLVPDNYRELTVELKHESGLLLRLAFRAYNEGAALRYEFPAQAEKEFRFAGEQTEFRFPTNTFSWEEHGTEGEYRRVRTPEIQPWCERPLTLEYASGLFASLTEAANEHYPRMLLSPLSGAAGVLVTALGGTSANTAASTQRRDPTATLAPGESTPWRVFVLGQKPGDLLERDYLLLNLNPPAAPLDFSWVKPGKVMRDITLTTTNSKAIIDFAQTAGLEYVLLDAGWYGTEDPARGDATTVRVPNLDIPEIIRYGCEEQVGLILYVDRRQIKKQRDVLFPLYQKWGVKGVKLGFVDVGPQTESAWMTETIQKAAEHHLFLNIHDGYRPTGLSRNWPNLLTVEGIRGNEHMPTPEHNCALPFTRYIAGRGDYTICYYDHRLKTTHAHQLAMSVISFSPLQTLFWYDKPSNYGGEPEIEFFRRLPTIWDETKVIDGKISQYAVVARRNGENWFIGAINDGQERHVKIPLDFLPKGKNYVAHIYSDDNTVHTRTKVGIESRTANCSTKLDVLLRAAGGQAIWLSPLTGTR